MYCITHFTKPIGASSPKLQVQKVLSKTAKSTVVFFLKHHELAVDCGP